MAWFQSWNAGLRTVRHGLARGLVLLSFMGLPGIGPAHAQIEKDLIEGPADPDHPQRRSVRRAGGPKQDEARKPEDVATAQPAPSAPLSETLPNTTAAVETALSAPPEPRPIVIDIRGSQSLYKPGDAVVLAVKADQDCNLTLISIEESGLATVLFPNEFEPDNHLAAGNTVHVPAPTAAYDLKVDKAGVESVVAICTATARRPFGVGHDYEQQRFTILGDWSAFTASAAEHEKAYLARLAEENRKRAGKRKDALPPISDPPPGPLEAEGRAILLLPVEAPPAGAGAARQSIPAP